jgi:hypothetical protein
MVWAASRAWFTKAAGSLTETKGGASDMLVFSCMAHYAP